MTESLSTGPKSAAIRFISSFNKQTRSSPVSETINQTDTSTTSSSFFFKRFSSARPRSSSPENKNSIAHHLHNSATTPADLNQVTIDLGSHKIETTTTEINYETIHQKLRDLTEINRLHFSQQKTDVCRRFENLLMQLLHTLELSLPLLRYLSDNFHHFDYSPEVKVDFQ